MLIIYYIILIIIIINIYINTKLKHFYFQSSVFVKKSSGYYFSMVYCLLFVFFFIFVLRLVRIATNNTKYLDLKIFVNFMKSFVFDHGLNYSIVCCLIIIFMFIFFRKLVISFTKFNFLRVFYIHRNLFVPGIYKIKDLQKKIFNKLPKNFNIILVFFFKNFLRILMLIFFIHAIFFNQGIMYIKFLPLYGLYYFLLNVIDNINKLDWEFDLVTSNIYKGLSFTNDCFFKLKEYHTYLIIGYSEYIFINSIDIILTKHYGKYITIKKDIDYFII